MIQELHDAWFSARQWLISSKVSRGVQPIPFVLVSGPRSGSTYLQKLLSSHPNVLCFHELMRKTAGTPVFNRKFLGQRNSLLKVRDQDMFDFVNRLLTGRYPKPILAVGFKALFDQPNDKSARQAIWLKLARLDSLRVVWLTRNPVARAISFAVARQTSRWIGGNPDQEVQLDPQYVLRRLRFEKNLESRTRECLAGLDAMNIHYEDLVGHQSKILPEVQRFLGVEETNLSTGMRRQSSDHYKKVIINFDDVAQTLLKSEFKDSFVELYG